MTRRDRIMQLSLREYLPLLLTIGLWAVIVAVIGHADSVRLLAATVAIRALQMLTRLSTASSLKARIGTPRKIRRHAKRMALRVHVGALMINLALVAPLVLGLEAIGQSEIAAFVTLISIGLPARALRRADLRTSSQYFRLALSGGGLVAALAGWAIGLGPMGMALAFGAREWIAYGVVRWWPKAAHVPKRTIAAPLTLAEVARNTAGAGRRRLTYRISKVALTMFGPIGNIAARTGRGLKWDRRLEPYLPHHLSGFILFASLSAAGAIFLALRIGEPVAMVGAAGLMQLAAAATNVALLWHWLPARDDPDLAVDDEDDD